MKKVTFHLEVFDGPLDLLLHLLSKNKVEIKDIPIAAILDQYLATEWLTSGELDRNLEKSLKLYKGKRDLMLSMLEKYMPQGVSWTHPEGGLFLFLTLPESIDAVALYDRALAAGVAYVAGAFFYPDCSHHNTMRLSFSFIDDEKIEPGIKILASLLR